MNASEGYQLVRRIGTGTSGAVYLAKTDTGEVAIRQFESKADPASQAWRDERQFFLNAGRQGLGLAHPRIVPVLEVIDEAGEAFVVMEYVAAPTLAAALAAGRLTPAETDTILYQVAQALDFAHGRGVVHGDLKPSDIFLTDKGAVVSDFAISPRARRYDRRPIDASLVHAHLSPEHLRDTGTIGPRSDQYALAVIAYQMYTGQSPYGASISDLPTAILSAPIAPPSQVDRKLPSSIDAPLLKALNRDPAQRYGTCTELAAFLGASLITQESAGGRVSKLVYVLVPLLLLALLLGIWFWKRLQPATRSTKKTTSSTPPISAGANGPTKETASTTGGKSKATTDGKKTTKKTTRKPTAPLGTGPTAQVARVKTPPPPPPIEKPDLTPITPQFTIDVLSQGNRIDPGLSFSAADPQLGEMAQGDLKALITFEGQHLKSDRLELKWIIDNVVMERKTVILPPDPRAKHAVMVTYGNEPTPGTYRVTLEQKGRLVQSFTFRITP